MNILLLARLVVAHVFVDFPLQKSEWIKQRRDLHGKSTSLWIHSFLQGIVAWIAVFQLQAWWIGVVILITHYLIDVWKSYRPEKLWYFFIDQGSHILVILILWGLYTGHIIQLPEFFIQIAGNNHFWIIVLGYMIAIWPTGIIIQLFVQYRFNTPGGDQGLQSAGTWIGYFERVLVVTLFLVSAYSALGLLIAAKSILRISTDKDSGRKETEYILIGTLMSWSLAILVGILLRYSLAHIQ